VTIRFLKNIFKGTASHSLLAVFFIGASACDRSSTPEWEGKDPTHSPPTTSVPRNHSSGIVSGHDFAPQERIQEIRFISYNVKNWLESNRFVNGKALTPKPKPADEKAAVISILTRHNPNVVGLCEIGTAADLAEIQQLLKDAGVDLPYSHFTGGADPVRHLGFLSRFPITSTCKPEKTEYQLQDKLYFWNRGVLDVTVDIHGRSLRFVGCHLKSKREVEEGDEEQMRRAESLLFRYHVDSIFAKNPDERLVVYGDFNDTRSSVTGRNITGSYNDPGYLTAIPAEDSVGTRWTHHWALHDIYARIDFIAISKNLKSDTDFSKAKILDDPEWSKASDHRALFAVFR
jgi:endonuclease/exonuclease/phosphatase family metal-dependent hydrolase